MSTISTNRRTELLNCWKTEEQKRVRGWDFSYLDGRLTRSPLPWSYMDLAAHALARSSSALDLDTGGGERFLQLKDRWPPKVTVTEEYPPNLAIVRETLGPLGVRVIGVPITETAALPFDSMEFDLVLNRHSPFNAREVSRVLNDGGTFLTQQVHGEYLADLLALFGCKPQWPFATLQRYAPLLEQANMKVIRAESCTVRVSYADVGAIVFDLVNTPWMVPGFSVEGYAETLLGLQERLDSGGTLDFSGMYYLIEARKG
jgi:hypothetical protein